MNELFIILDIVVTFALVLLAHRFFGKEGLIAWVGIATILANIMTAKTVEAFGFSFTIGNALFASTFLATDILTECYGKKDALKAVFTGFFSATVFIISSQIALLYAPSSYDYADGAMRDLFTISVRISVSSLIMYLIANLADVFIYEKIKQKTGGKHMWLRNNLSTILCNCLENFFFMGMAFYGMYSLQDIIQMALATSVIEIIAGVCDTPFLYLATKSRKGKDLKNGKQTISPKIE